MKEPVFPLGAIVYVIFVWMMIREHTPPIELGIWYLISLVFVIAQGYPSTTSNAIASWVWNWIVFILILALFTYAMMNIFARYAVVEGFQSILRL
jgi:hypothetical protein